LLLKYFKENKFAKFTAQASGLKIKKTLLKKIMGCILIFYQTPQQPSSFLQFYPAQEVV